MSLHKLKGCALDDGATALETGAETVVCPFLRFGCRSNRLKETDIWTPKSQRDSYGPGTL